MNAWSELPGVDAPPRLTLVLGGARSGKSRLAERLTRDADPAAMPVYIATAQAFDDEMRARIAQHQADRGADWMTVEAPEDLSGAIRAAGTVPALVDCLTLWLSNRMLADADLETDRAGLMAALADRRAPTVLVSNEVGLGIVPDTPLGRRFRDAQGILNQAVAAAADCVIFTAAGLPMVMKRP
ncbi:MAG: bifunctional adenosylcobinamide kinase/adenosylcobinamide-phosphate guanylyltransferase [Minwuia sp.]|uniref:bifunctional adenosylcobinamide kinase/adenosylcobinamide-phosphate guanylyltransferase n=1 Tax=Minwuia sp. TaxID=2493630 RepID=UPI003A87F332